MGCPALDSEYYDFIVRSEFHFLPIYFDKPVHQSNISAGKILLEREKPSAALFTPQSLAFQFNLNSYLVNVKTSSLPAGVSREVQIYRPNGQGVKYQFKTGDSLATPIEKDVAFDSKVRMIDAYGNPVTDNPAYYERIFPNGSKVRFPAGQTGVPPVINGNKGEDIAADSPDVMVEPIYRDNSIRQIWSAADGLADFVIIDDYKYEIRLYAPENAGSKNTQGLYEPNGNPFELWTVENPNMSDTNFNSARITQTVNGTAYVYDWAYTEGTNAWTVTSGAGLRKSAKFYFGDYTTGNCQIVEEVRNVSNSLVSKKVSNTQKLAWGPAVVSEVVDPDGANLVTTYTYYTVSTETGKYGKVKTVQKPDGSWESYDYDSQGRKTLTVSSYLDAAFNSAAGSAKAEYYSYTSLDSADVLQTNDGRPRTIETKILGNTVSKKYFVYKTVNGEVVEIEEEGIAAFGNSANQRKTTVYYANSANDASKTRVKSISWPDGKLDSYTYEYGTYSANQDPASCSFSAGSGDALRQTIVHGTVANSGGIAGKTTKETSVTDGRSNEAMTETYAYDGSGYSRIAWNVRTFDSEHHVLASYNSNGTYSTATWNCCSKDSETTADGTQYTFSYNLLKQMISKTKCSAGNLPAITNSYTYDAEGHQLSETISGGSALVATSSSYDLAGRATSRTDVAGLTTTYAYSNGGRTVTVTHPGGFTEITDKYLDGKIKSVTGTAIVAKYYTYGVNTDGTQWTKICNVALNGANYVKTTVDALGRTISEEKPGYTGTLVSNYFYNNQGLLIKTTSTGKPDTLYAYDDFNNRTMSCLDLNANGTIDTASVDRVSESEVSYQYESGQWWSVDTSKVYNDSGDAVTTGITKKQLTGLASGTIAVTVSTDINGNDTISTTTLDRTNKTVTQTVNVPDSTADEVSVTVNGLLSPMSTKSSLSYSYSYDGLGRKIGDTDPRTGTSVTHYNSYGHVDYVEDAAGKRTSFTYESSTGRRASVINALNKATANTYNSRGQILTVRGDTTYPLDYVYDSYGRMTQLKTYRNSNLTNPDITIWTYQDSTGFLLSKTYADNKSVSYTYSVEGKLATRTWARTSGGNPLTTTYSYNLAGDMTDIDYSDSTPDIAFTYNRLGQQLTVTDAVGSRTFSYNGVFQLTGEAITGIYNKTINRSYDILGGKTGSHSCY
jgi:YD repeat-containing protein